MFINIYKTADECLQSSIIDITKEVYVILKFQMKLFLKVEVDQYWSNLFTIKEVAIIISDKYNKDGFNDIILIYYYLKNNNNPYHTVSSNSSTDISLHYILFFLNSNPG